MTREGVTWDEVTHGAFIPYWVFFLLIWVFILVGFLQAYFSVEQKTTPSPIKVESFFDVKYLDNSVDRLDGGDLPQVTMEEVPKELPLEATKCDVISGSHPRIYCEWVHNGIFYNGVMVVPVSSSDTDWNYDEVSHRFEPTPYDPYKRVKDLGYLLLLCTLWFSFPLYCMFKFFYLKLVEVIRR